MLDPQVQTRIIEIAWMLAQSTSKETTGPNAGKNTMELFDQAYKALLKTVKGDPAGPPKTKGFA